MEDMSDEDEEGYKDSIFNRDDEEFTGLGQGGGTGSTQHTGFMRQRKEIFECLNEKVTPSTIKNLQITANVLFFTLLIVAGVEFFITDQEFSNVKDNVGLIDFQENRVANMQIVLQMLTDLVQMNMGITPLDNKRELRARNIMTSTILELRKIQETILLDDIKLDDESLR